MNTQEVIAWLTNQVSDELTQSISVGVIQLDGTRIIRNFTIVLPIQE